MGNSVSEAKEKATKQKAEINSLLAILENKRREFLEKVELSRGEGASNQSREVSGGRTLSRISELRVKSSAGPDPGIENAIGSFFEAAQGGDKAKNAAVQGAKSLLVTGLDALFGASSGQGLEKEGFVCLFLNYAFVRVDFFVYTYTVKGDYWGAEASQSGSCYVADIAVLNPIKDIRASEMDFLLGQSLSSVPPAGVGDNEDPNSEFYIILKMKIQLVESAILSRLLDQDDLTLDQLREYTTELIKTQTLITQSFSQLSDFDQEPFVPSTSPTKPILVNFDDLVSLPTTPSEPISIRTGEVLNNVFAQGILLNKHIKMTARTLGIPLREDPSDPKFLIGVNDSVTQQGWRVSCCIDNNGDLLIVRNPKGRGLLLPYLGVGSPKGNIGVAVTAGRGLGTYTMPIETGGPISWICTGRFNGCYSYSIRNERGGDTLVFGHLVTPSSGNSVDTVDNQALNIQTQTGFDALTVEKNIVTPPVNLKGADGGYVFWMETESKQTRKWVCRQIWTNPSDAIQKIDNQKMLKVDKKVQ